MSGTNAKLNTNKPATLAAPAVSMPAALPPAAVTNNKPKPLSLWESLFGKSTPAGMAGGRRRGRRSTRAHTKSKMHKKTRKNRK